MTAGSNAVSCPPHLPPSSATRTYGSSLAGGDSLGIMNCRNCGAPMELFERRRYYFCTFCGSFSFIDTLAVEGVRILERPMPAPECPLCRAPLVKALLDDAYSVEHCERCRGILLARSKFAEAI